MRHLFFLLFLLNCKNSYHCINSNQIVNNSNVSIFIVNDSSLNNGNPFIQPFFGLLTYINFKNCTTSYFNSDYFLVNNVCEKLKKNSLKNLKILNLESDSEYFYRNFQNLIEILEKNPKKVYELKFEFNNLNKQQRKISKKDLVQNKSLEYYNDLESFILISEPASYVKRYKKFDSYRKKIAKKKFSNIGLYLE